MTDYEKATGKAKEEAINETNDRARKDKRPIQKTL